MKIFISIIFINFSKRLLMTKSLTVYSISSCYLRVVKYKNITLLYRALHEVWVARFSFYKQVAV
jgi:hypothetical protein